MASIAQATTPSGSSSAQPARAGPTKASRTAWIAVLAGMIGAFMAILNIQITNASLLDIEGGIGTGVDNGAWISTSYLIGEIVVIPLTDYLSRVFSFRRYMLANTILFALFSIGCAFAHDLGSMIVMRGLQGFAGGVLIPMAFTMVLTKLPKAQQPIGLAHVCARRDLRAGDRPDHRRLPDRELRLADHLLRQHPAEHRHDRRALSSRWSASRCSSLLKEGDWAGIVTMAIGLSALQTVLEEGNKDDWFASPFIVELALMAAVFLTAFILIELIVKKPLVDLRLLKRRNFGIGVSSTCWSASRCSAPSTSCRNISARCSATTPSRSATCWPGPACRSF